MKQKKRALIFLGLVIFNLIILVVAIENKVSPSVAYLVCLFIILNLGGYCVYTSIVDYLDDKRGLDIAKVKGENVDSCDFSED